MQALPRTTPVQLGKSGVGKLLWWAGSMVRLGGLSQEAGFRKHCLGAALRDRVGQADMLRGVSVGKG